MNIHSAALRGSLLLTAMAVPLAAAGAQESHQGDIVVTAHRVFESDEIQRTAGGTDLVKAEDYDEKLAVSLRDALAFSPGVYAQPRFGQEVRLSIRGSGISRGFHMRGLTLLQDGVPINLADDNGDFQELDPLVLDRIEIFRGGNALRFGGSTLGGAVNGITPRGNSAPGLNVRIDGGSFGTLRAKAALGLPGEQVDGWLAVTGDTSDGDRVHSRRRSLRFHANVAVRLADDIETHFHASSQSIRQELPGALTYSEATHRPRKGNRLGDQQRNINSLRLQNRTHIELGAAMLEIGAFTNLKDLDHPIFEVVDQRSTDWGGFARLEVKRGPIEATFGSTARFGTIDSKRFFNNDGEPGALRFEADLTARTIDVYGEARYQVGALSLIAGAIYTHGTRKQDQKIRLGIPEPVKSSARFSEFSPKFGLLYEPRDGLQFYANYSRSHELPGFIELSQIATFVPLKAQRAWTAEIGGRGRIGIARFDVSLYRATLKNEMLQFSIAPPDIPASTFNADRTLHQGIEAGLDLDLKPWLRLRQVYQYNDFRFRNDAQFGDNRLPVVPKHLYRAEVRIGSDRLHISPSLEWAPQGAWADYRNSRRVKGYALLGVSGEAALNDRLSLFVDLRNITGVKAIGDISAVVDAVDASAIFYPVERRSIFGGVRARF